MSDTGREAACPQSGPVEGVWGNREVPPAKHRYAYLRFFAPSAFTTRRSATIATTLIIEPRMKRSSRRGIRIGSSVSVGPYSY